MLYQQTKDGHGASQHCARLYVSSALGRLLCGTSHARVIGYRRSEGKARSELELTWRVDGGRDLAECGCFGRIRIYLSDAGDARRPELRAVGNVIAGRLKAHICFLEQMDVFVERDVPVLRSHRADVVKIGGRVSGHELAGGKREAIVVEP